jgi:undecaprenyl-diphosphatase
MTKAVQLRATPAFYLTLVGLLGFMGVAYLVTTDRFSAFDTPIITWMQSWESPTWTALAEFCALLGSAKIVIILSIITMVLLYFVLKHRSELIFFLIVIGGSASLNVILKSVFSRERPTIHRILEETGYSFPSGHAMGAFSFYASIAFLLWRHIPQKWGRVLLILAAVGMILMIGLSRVYAGVHYPSDILAGYLISGCWLAFWIYWYQWYKERSQNQPRK